MREQAKRLHSALVQCLPSDLQLRVESKILRVLSGLGDHVLTHELEAALAGLIAALEAAGRAHTANALRVARDKLACSIGMLGARVLTLTPLKLLDRLAAKEKPHGTRRITLIEWESRSWGDKLLDALAGLIEFAVVTPRQVAGRDGSYASTRSPLTAQSLRLP